MPTSLVYSINILLFILGKQALRFYNHLRYILNFNITLPIIKLECAQDGGGENNSFNFICQHFILIFMNYFPF